ncbi:ParB/RepB/Spo0J family partition protein [Xanthobacteraceae bacterium Astr-EGSB]|uniref:ParB/RepB/Spo0J family partition protein n=1 Tax=Astrobacterium formosum TaxID=3069710 RepID=UPI0027B5A041|nr:ParB/RepB/Spo0J family partition protein [Xanthobacteraceae bacterium Astr-EGSB]
MAEERSRLGRGLASLIGDMGAEAGAQPERGRGARKAPVEHLRPNARNPRSQFSETELDDLANSIRERGIIQPIVVRTVRGLSDAYEIIAGERRWRAAQRAGLHDVPIVVHEASDAEALELAIVENVQRADLDPIEEANGYSRLMAEFSYTQDDVAKIVGKSRPHVANTLRLLKLPESVQALVHAGELSAGHARMLVGHGAAGVLAREIVQHGLNVRQVEAIIRDGVKPGTKKARAARTPKDADTAALEKRLTDALGLSVTIDHKDEAGTVRIAYRDLDQLDEVIRRLEKR